MPLQRPNHGSSPTTFTGAVTLRKRISKNIYDLDTVRLIPHPALEIATAAEAKHYAATYAMFRVSAVISDGEPQEAPSLMSALPGRFVTGDCPVH